MKKVKKILGGLLCFCLLASHLNVHANISNNMAKIKDNEVKTTIDKILPSTTSEQNSLASHKLVSSISTLENTQSNSCYETDTFRIIFSVTNQWNDGFNGNIRIENLSNERIHDWCLQFSFNNTITNIWNAEIVNYTDDIYRLKNLTWNQDIDPNQYVEFGFTCTNTLSSPPNNYSLLNVRTESATENYSISYATNSFNDTGFIGMVTIQNISNKQIDDWQLSFSFQNNIDDIWDAEILLHEDNNYIIKNPQYNQNIPPNQSISFYFTVNNGNISEVISNLKLEECIMQDFDPSDNNAVINIGELYFKKPSSNDILFDKESGILYVKNQLLISALPGLEKSIVSKISEDINAQIVGYIETTNDYQIEFKEDKSYDQLLDFQESLDDLSFLIL